MATVAPATPLRHRGAILPLSVALVLLVWGSIGSVLVWGRPRVAHVRSAAGLRAITSAQLPEHVTVVGALYQPGIVPQAAAVLTMPAGVLRNFAAARGAGSSQSGVCIWQTRTNGLDLKRLPQWHPERVHDGWSWDEETAPRGRVGPGHLGYLAAFDEREIGRLYLYWSMDW